MASGLTNSFLAAIQASLSVLLVIIYGAVAARLNLLDSKNGKVLSKLCVKMFLPALLFTKIGSELHSESAHRYGIILIWALVCHFVSFLIGVAAHYFLHFPDWITVAIMFNNTTSYPLLLIQALDETGILKSLIVTDESTREAIERAKSYFLVFATVSSCLTFAVGPRLIDSEHAFEPDDHKSSNLEHTLSLDHDPFANARRHDSEPEANEQTALIEREHRRMSKAAVTFFPSRRISSPENLTASPSGYVTLLDRRPSVVSKRTWLNLGPRAKWWLLFAFDFLNAPLLGAVVGAIVGLIPFLHRAFFSPSSDGGIFTAWLTASFKTVASLFVPLPVLIAGVSLYTSYMKAKGTEEEERRGALPIPVTIFILIIRFVIWPIASIAAIYYLAKHQHALGDDPMLWFAMMLMPTGPPAMKLITMVAVSNAGEEEENIIAKLLTASRP